MIVPRFRLLFWVAVVVLPFALLGAVSPPAAGISLWCIGGLLAVVLADAVGAGKSLAGISVELPSLTRMSKDREAKLELRIRNERQQPRSLRVALAWPRGIQTAAETLDAWLPAQSEWSRLAWPCTPLRRGNYRFAAAYVEGSSPFGFWGVRKTLPVQSEVRVYPNLLNERKSLAALFLNRGVFGLHAQRQVGKGRDFEKLREYVPGDDYSEIHWKATARRGKPITKVFQIEKTQEVYVIVDAKFKVQGSRFKVAGRCSTWNFEPGTWNFSSGTFRDRRAGARAGGGAAGGFVRLADVYGQGGKVRARQKRQDPLQRVPRCALHPGAENRHAGL
jgi:uncharacterized protein (DUF58 family)